ncbi:MAG TPA: hypothetical protein VKV80_05230 [Streptosporangiaceae bacterium]|nr:hypothetical protein [Streptosporangiaceae bacterium]
MNLVTLVIDSVLLLGMIGTSLYGAAALPAGAQVPVHFGPAGYNRWVPRNAGLVMWPAIGVVVYVILVIMGRSQRANGGSGPPIGLTIALAVMLVTQVGALRVALSRSGRDG